MKYSIQDFRNDISDCVDLCNQYVADRKNGIEGEATLKQLENEILPELNKFIELIDENKLPLPKKLNERYFLSFAKAFTMVWSWNMRNPTALFDKLCELNKNYKLL